MSEKKQPTKKITPENVKPGKAPVYPDSRQTRRQEATAPQPYLGGTVQSMAAEEQQGRRVQVTTREASAQLLAAIKTARELGGVVEGNVVRIPMIHTGIAAIDFLAKNGYRIIGT
jgi:transaldolase